MGVGLPGTQWLLKAGLPKAPEPMRETAKRCLFYVTCTVSGHTQSLIKITFCTERHRTKECKELYSFL